MDKELMDMLQFIVEKLDRQDQRFSDIDQHFTAIDQRFTTIDQRFDQLEEKIDAVETRLALKIENEVARRIDSLFDGYKLAHEKQWELERKVDAMERRLEALESKAC